MNDQIILSIAKKGDLDCLKKELEKRQCKSYDNLLKCATKRGRLNVIKYVLEDIKPDVNVYKLMNYAASEGHLDVIKYFVSLGAAVNDEKCLVLKAAVMEGQVEIVKYLLSIGADPKKYLVQAASYGNKEILGYMLDVTSDVSYDKLLDEAIRNDRIGTMKFLIDRSNEWVKALTFACIHGNMEAVTYITSIMGHGHADYKHIIKPTITAGRLDVLKHFVSIGVVIDETKYVRYAVRYGRYNVVEYLFSIGCPVDYSDKSLPKFIANHGVLWLLKKFVENGADITGEDHEVMRLAINGEHDDMVEYLLSRGLVDSRVDEQKIDRLANSGMLRSKRIKYLMRDIRHNPTIVVDNLMKKLVDINIIYDIGSVLRYVIDRFGVYDDYLDPHVYIRELDERHVKYLKKYPNIIGIISRKVRRYHWPGDAIFSFDE